MTVGGALKLLFCQPKTFLESLMRIPFFAKMIPDRTAISIFYRLRFKRHINLDTPQSFNEKLLWLTLYDRQPEYVRMVDKYDAKNWIREKLSSAGMDCSCIIPTYGVYNHYEDIDFDKLPISFVIKTTHDSGGVVVVNDKDNLNHIKAKQKLEKSLKRNYFWFTREWPYRDVKPKIIVEKKLETIEPVPIDWKIFCLNGKAKFWFIAYDRSDDVKFDFYDMDWNKLPFIQGHPNSQIITQKPDCWDKMVEYAEFLSKNIPCLRVDFYIDKYGQFYIGELTFTHFSGLVPFEPDEWDYKLGELIKLPNNCN